jgi:hypothetical protein
MDMARGLCVWSLLVAVALTGCGGGGSSHEQPMSKTQFVSRANAICVTGEKRLKALQKPTDIPGIATFMAAALPITEQALTKLEALVPPAADQKRYARLLGIMGQAISKVSEDRSAAEAGDAQRVQRLDNDLSALEQRENSINEELGLKQCVSNEETEG